MTLHRVMYTDLSDSAKESLKREMRAHIEKIDVPLSSRPQYVNTLSGDNITDSEYKLVPRLSGSVLLNAPYYVCAGDVLLVYESLIAHIVSIAALNAIQILGIQYSDYTNVCIEYEDAIRIVLEEA